MKYFITAIAYILSLLLTGAATLFLVLVVAGPHAGLLPTWLEIPVVLLGWVVILAGPVLIARSVWRRCNRHPQQGIR